MPLRIKSCIWALYIDVQSGIALIQFAHCFSEAHPLEKNRWLASPPPLPVALQPRSNIRGSAPPSATEPPCFWIPPGRYEGIVRLPRVDTQPRSTSSEGPLKSALPNWPALLYDLGPLIHSDLH